MKRIMKKRKIDMNSYQRRMDKIIAKGLPVQEALIEMLEEAAKYEIIEKKKREKQA